MKLCAFADEACPQISGQIAALKRNGYDYLEIRGVNEKNILHTSCAEIKEVKKQLDDAGISVWSMGSPIGKIGLYDNFEEHIDHFKHIMELADILGTKRIRMFSFFPAKGQDRASAMEQSFERLNKFCEIAPSDFILCHENEKEIFGENPENCLAIHKTFPRIKAVFDPANFVQCGVDTLKAWEMLSEYVDYMHVKDALANGYVVPAGLGVGNVEQIVKMYAAKGGQVLTLEPHLQCFVGLSDLESGEIIKQTGIKYSSHDESFDAAVKALNDILAKV